MHQRWPETAAWNLQVTVGFAPHIVGQGPVAQVEQLRKLAAALDRASRVDLAGVHVMLGGEYGVDSLGRLWLDADESALSWSGCASCCCAATAGFLHLCAAYAIKPHIYPAELVAYIQERSKEQGSPGRCRYLMAVDVAECHERQEAAARVRRLEASVAALLGLSMVYCTPSLRMKPAFLRCLTLIRSLSVAFFHLKGGLDNCK